MFSGTGATFARMAQGGRRVRRRSARPRLHLSVAQGRDALKAPGRRAGGGDRGDAERPWPGAARSPTTADGAGGRPRGQCGRWRWRGLEARTPRHVIELCLQAVRAGLLRTALGPALPALPRRQGAGRRRSTSCRAGAHCSSCNIDYDRDFSRNVEASFRPAAAVRAARERRILPVRARCRRRMSRLQVPLRPGETRDARGRPAARPLSPAHARAGPGGRDRLAGRRFSRRSILDDGRVDAGRAGGARPDSRLVNRGRGR